MADNTTLNSGSGGDTISTDDIGGGVKVQRVKIQHGADGSATDVSTASPLPISDAGGSVTVDGTVTVQDGGSTISVDDGGGSVTVDGTVAVSSIAAGNNNIGDVDVASVTPGTGADNLGKREDFPHSSNDVGVFALAVRHDTATNSGAADGDYIAISTDSLGRVRVTQADVTQPVDTELPTAAALADATATPTAPAVGSFPHLYNGTTWDRVRGDTTNGLDVDVTRVGGGSVAHDAVGTGVNPLLTGGYASSTVPTAVSAAGDAVRTWLGLSGETVARLVDDAGDSCMDGTNNALRVNVVTGGGSGGTSITDDAAFTPGSTAVTPVAGTYRSSRDLVDDNDAGALAMTQRRGLLVSPETPAGDSLADDTNDHLRVGGPFAHDTANAGNVNPLLIGARAADSPLSAVSTDGDAVMARADRLGQLFVRLADSTGDSVADDTNNAIRVNVVAGGSSGNGTSMNDDAAFTVGTTAFTPVGGTYRSVRDSLDDGDGGAVALTQTRAQYVTLEDSAGNPLGTASAPLRIDPVGTTAQPVITSDYADTDSITSNGDTATQVQVGGAGRGTISFDISGTWVATLQFEYTLNLTDWLALPVYASMTSSTTVTSTTANGQWFAPNVAFQRVRVRASAYTSGTAVAKISQSIASWTPPGAAGAGGTQYAEDAAASSGDTGTLALAVRRDTAASSSGTDGDYSTLNVNASGRLYTSSTVDAALPAGTNNIGDVDVLSVVPGTGATALGKAEDAAHTSGDVGVMALAVRKDTPGTGLGADGDYTPLEVDSTGALRVAVVSGGSGAVQGLDAHDAAVTGAPVLVGGYASAAAPANTSADGDATRFWVLRSGAQATVLTAAGALIGGDATNGLDVDVTRIIPGTSATHLGKAEDAAHADGDTGVAVLAVRRDTAAVGSGTDGDYSTLNVNASGRLYTSTTVDAALPAGTNNIGDVDVLTLPGVAGTAAHDAAVSGNPVLIGMEARTSDGTAVSNGDAVRPMASTLGKQIVHLGSILGNQIQGNLNETNNTASDVIAAQAAGVKIAVMSVTVINKHTTVSTTIAIRDGTTTKIGPLQCKADGGGFHMTGGGFPLFVGTAATAVTALAGTTGSDVDIFISGYLTTE